MRAFIAISITLLSPLAHAGFSSGLGFFSHNMNSYTQTDDAKKSTLGSTFLPLIVRYNSRPFWGPLLWSPYFEFTHLTTLLVKNETPDGSAKRNFAIVSSPLVYPVSTRWFISGGPGFMYYELKGKGGTMLLSNGTGTTNFARPSKTRTSKIFLLEVGTGWQLTNWRIALDLFLSGFGGGRTSTSFQASFTYSFGGRAW